MNCATHTTVPAAAYCRTCGKALCEECKREVRGVIYCEECIARRMETSLPTAAPGTPAGAPAPAASPGGSNAVAATLLGFIPGVGQMYNGEFGKAFLYVVIFASLVWASDRADVFGLFAFVFYFYMVFDAYRVAKARQLGQPVPADLFGMGGSSVDSSAAGLRHEFAHVPIGAIVLIVLGALFLLENLWHFHLAWIGRLWPLILIAIGIRIFMRRSTRQNGRTQ
ncbi:MAG TPA: B-box zinc finger protein [Terriglobales bacterium]|nr:B-box zinc finger protein [Terriglobales bacterium]